MEIVRIVLPIAITGGVVLFVVKRLEHKHKLGNLGKKKTNKAQNLLDSLIPMGMLFGCLIGVISGMFSPISPLTTISLGTVIGYLLGYFAYEIYSKIGDSPS
ncbi:hypothetical protein ACFSTA_09595 [Ornithinibacillus salinisoli]|uniref:Group-specific protein n=1 Tax=Ornithinibacillus salinisoli TaxID=1848459 RepID=A0ABW4W033_9BACI